MYYSVNYCLKKIRQSYSRNKSAIFSIKDEILAMLVSQRSYEECAERANNWILSQIEGVPSNYDRDWLINLLDTAMLEKALDSLGYQPFPNPHKSMKALRA